MGSEQWTCFDADQPSGWGEDDFREFVEHHQWQFAKTMPENPHEYTLRRNTTAELFDSAVRFIRENGCMEQFAGKPYRTLYFGDHKYWTMGAPLPQTILINRKPRASGVTLATQPEPGSTHAESSSNAT